MRTQWERDAKVRFRISLPSFEKIDSQIPELKKLTLDDVATELFYKQFYNLDHKWTPI